MNLSRRPWRIHRQNRTGRERMGQRERERIRNYDRTVSEEICLLWLAALSSLRLHVMSECCFDLTVRAHGIRHRRPPYAEYAEVRHTVNSSACISAINFWIIAAAPRRYFFAVYGQPKLFRSRWLVLRTACLLLDRFITHFYAVINTHGFRVIRYLTNTDRQQQATRSSDVCIGQLQMEIIALIQWYIHAFRSARCISVTLSPSIAIRWFEYISALSARLLFAHLFSFPALSVLSSFVRFQLPTPNWCNLFRLLCDFSMIRFLRKSYVTAYYALPIH